MPQVRIGVSGWRYTPWRGVFYPRDLPQRLELRYASRCFPTLEINGSFYSLQRPEYYRHWHDETPDDFVFALKGSRYITHMKKLRDIEAPLANYFASGVFNLRAKLGPILWQFPPNFRYERERMARFFDLLPQDTSAAVRLARKRDARLKGRARLASDRHRPLRHAPPDHQPGLYPDRRGGRSPESAGAAYRRCLGRTPAALAFPGDTGLCRGGYL